MVLLGAHTWEGRSSAEKPEIQARPEVARQPEVEIPTEIPAPIHVTRGFGFTRPDSVSEEMPVDNRETVQTFVFSVRPETLSGNPEKPETTSVTVFEAPLASRMRFSFELHQVHRSRKCIAA